MLGAGKAEAGVEVGEEVNEGAEEGVGPEGKEVTTGCRELDRGRGIATLKLDCVSVSRAGGEVAVAYAIAANVMKPRAQLVMRQLVGGLGRKPC